MPVTRLHTLHTLLALLAASLSSGILSAEPTAEPSQKKPAWNVNQPPGEARTVQIDTRTGTWMSVDVSPDGKTIIFDLLGDLYTLPIEGGEAKPLTHSIAWEQQARFSPDGKQIDYLSDAGGGDNVWVMNVDGSGAKAVTHEDYRLLNNPVWHPNGRFIAARKHYTGTRSAGSGDLALPRERRQERHQGRAAQREAQLAEGPGRARHLARWQVPLLLARRHARQDLRVQQGLQHRDLQDLPPRPARRLGRALRAGPRWGGAPHPVA
jgi:dipeptidyl aminopeptidase/acylaminoacyl peptidase